MDGPSAAEPQPKQRRIVFCRIADLQSAGHGQTKRPGGARQPAEYNSAIQQITNLRYVAGQRWQKVCAEKQNFHG
jgi:hypothetical protein